MPGIDECLAQAMAIPGVRGASLVDWTSGLALGAVGEGPNGDHETTAAETTELARAAVEHGSFSEGADRSEGSERPGEDSEDGTGVVPVEDIIVVSRGGYHLMRFVDTTFESSVFLYLWVDRAEGNLAVARLRLHALADSLVLV